MPETLDWVVPSPSGEYFLTGSIRERHSAKIHDQLLAVGTVEPEEDLDVQLYNRDLQRIASTASTSTPLRPALTDAGELHVSLVKAHRWRITEARWNGSEHEVATIVSQCTPRLATPLTGYIFVVGCTPAPTLHWFRVLRMDGHVVLKERGSSQEMGQAADGASDGSVAVRTVRAATSMQEGAAFHKGDLREQQISVYRLSDGHPLLQTVSHDVSLSEQSFALAPDGSQVAVLGGKGVLLFPLPVSAQAAASAQGTPALP